MQPRQCLRSCVIAMLSLTVTAAWAQARPCSEVPPAERELARASGACRDRAPIIDVAPNRAGAPTVVVSVPNVVGLTFDDARTRLAGFELVRSYRASGEPGGMVLAQEPAAPARVAVGAAVRVVLSDGSLRPPPRVAESQIDGVPKPLEARAPPSVAPKPPEASMPQQARTEPVSPSVQRSAETSAAPATEVTAVQRKDAARSKAPSLRTRGKPAAPNAVASGAPPRVTETIEMPNVIGRSGADASRLLVEFKADRIEVVASAAPSGQILAQDPVPGTLVPPGSKIGLQVSDGSLAQAAGTTPAVLPTPSPVTPPVETSTNASAAPVTTSGNAAPILVAIVLLGLVLGALLMRRRALRRETPADTEAFAPVNVASAETDRMGGPPEIRVGARLDAGETTIEFTAPVDADEATIEHSRELHE